MSQNLESVTGIPPEDYRWLKHEAEKRRITVAELINQLMEQYWPNGFHVPRPMKKEELEAHFGGLVLQLVRRARMDIQ